MKVWVYVEGQADRVALEALWENWRKALRSKGHGIKIVTLDNKSNFFKKIGPRVSEKLVGEASDIVVGLPDLYPNSPYQSTKYKHSDIDELKRVQQKEVSAALEQTYSYSKQEVKKLLERFLGAALKHDLEMLLLAAKDELRSYLRTSDQLGSWKNPVEEQDQERPPKYIVEELFVTKSSQKRAYRDTIHARAVLQKVSDIKKIIFANNQIQCPIFKSVLDWIGEKTGVPAYQ
ncbi:MAG: hypothetical protein DRP65_06830 [Planctomycetota bacterium]|nr:MAG: hypothetical protein DRP65_06830 [Planctomycetota bacterium]